MNRANMVGRIAIALIDEGVDLNTVDINDMCHAIPCGTTDCGTCPFDSMKHLKQFKQDYQNDNS